MKLKHLLALIWVLAYRTDWMKTPHVSFDWFRTEVKLFEGADEQASNGSCPLYAISIDTNTLVTTKYLFSPPYCKDGETGRKLVSQQTNMDFRLQP